jgi:hypothetical protein
MLWLSGLGLRTKAEPGCTCVQKPPVSSIQEEAFLPQPKYIYTLTLRTPLALAYALLYI